MGRPRYQVAAALFVVLPALAAQAGRTSVTFQILPKGERFILPSGEEARLLALDEWLQLAVADAELAKLRSETATQELLIDLYAEAAGAKGQIVEAVEKNNQVLKNQSERLEERWHACEDALVKSSSPSYWPYAVALFGTLLGAAGLTVLATK
jgi:hypothetical protein